MLLIFQGRPLLLLVPGVKNLAAPLDTINWQLFKENNTDLAQQTWYNSCS